MSLNDAGFWKIVDAGFTLDERMHLFELARNAMDSDSFSKHYGLLDEEYRPAPKWEDFS